MYIFHCRNINKYVFLVFRMAGRYDDLSNFCKGLGSARAEEVGNATYIGKRIFGLKMPDDFEPEAQYAVFSHTVSRHLFLIHAAEYTPEWKQNIKTECYNFYEVGRCLASLNKNLLRLAALYLAYKEKYPEKFKKMLNFNQNEGKVARHVIAGLRKIKRNMEDFEMASSHLERLVSTQTAPA